MLKFLRRRLLQLAPVLLGVSILVFFGMHLIPGDVAQLLLGDKGTDADLQRIRHQLGLDRPVYIQYVRFLGGILQGDFGVSIRTRQPVIWEIGQALPVTVQLSLAALAFAVVFGLLIGVLAARYPRSALDTGSMVGVLAVQRMMGPELSTLCMIHLSQKNNHESIVRDMAARLLARTGVQLELGIASQFEPTGVFEVARRRAPRPMIPPRFTQMQLFSV